MDQDTADKRLRETSMVDEPSKRNAGLFKGWFHVPPSMQETLEGLGFKKSLLKGRYFLPACFLCKDKVF